MGLDFLSNKDKVGAAFYVIYDGSHRQQQYWEAFVNELEQDARHQTHLFSVKSHEGEKLRSFYGYSAQQLPVAFIVRDDDQLAYQWVGSEHLSPPEVSTLLNKESHLG